MLRLARKSYHVAKLAVLVFHEALQMLFFFFFLFRVFAAVHCVARGHLVEVLGKTPSVPTQQ